LDKITASISTFSTSNSAFCSYSMFSEVRLLSYTALRSHPCFFSTGVPSTTSTIQ
jgi:hypothetical protein